MTLSEKSLAELEEQAKRCLSAAGACSDSAPSCAELLLFLELAQQRNGDDRLIERLGNEPTASRIAGVTAAGPRIVAIHFALLKELGALTRSTVNVLPQSTPPGPALLWREPIASG